MNGFTLGFTLKQRRNATHKSAIPSILSTHFMSFLYVSLGQFRWRSQANKHIGFNLLLCTLFCISVIVPLRDNWNSNIHSW